MTILQQPDALSFSMNLKPFKISTSEEVEFSLMQGGETLLSEMLSPDADGQIELSLRDIIHDRLSCQVPPTADPYVQSSVVADFTAVIGSTSVTFRVIRGGVDRLSGTVNDFLRANFLTWQPNVKPVTYSSPEFLSYYAVDSGCKLKVKAYFTDSAGNVTPGAVKTICSLAQGVVTTVSVQYAVIAGLYSGSLPAYYDVWVASGSTVLTYTQRYFANTMQSEEEQWIFFENSLGGIDTFRTFGAVTLDAEHTHHIAEIDDVSYEYRVDTERKWTVNTGHLDISERRWLLDFFPSAGKYVYAGSAVRRIVLTDDSVSYRFRELPSSYSFTFRFAETLPLLNLPRHELPVEMLDITVPDIGSFTLPPRLLEFSRLPLSEGVLFPVQSPYAEEWQVVTMGGITQYLRSVLDIPSPGLGRTDIIRLLSAQLTPLDPLHPEESRIDPSWLPEGYGAIDIEHVTGLREELDSKLDTRFFSSVFTVYDGSGNAIVPNTYEQVADNLKIMVGAWTDQYLSALGLNSQGGGGETGGVSGIRVSSSSVLTPDDEGVVNMTGYIIQPAEKTRWDAAAAMRHGHSNKSILDSITSQQISSWNALTTVRILPGDGLAGGGDLSADVTLSVKLASNSGLSVSSGGLKLDAVNALNSTLTYKALSAAQGKALNDRLAILEAMFTREGSGTSADPYVIRANYGLYTDSFLSALGLNSQGGGGSTFDEAQMWIALGTDVGTKVIDSSHIPDTSSLYGYLKKHQTLYTLSIYGGTTKVLDFKPDANASIYIKAGGDISLANDTTNRYITLSYSHPTGGANATISAANGRVLSAITVNSLGHVTSVSSKTLAAADIPSLAWDKITSGKPTTLGGYGITDAKIASGVITLGSNTITPVTSVAMKVPTGFSISGTPISKTGTLALTFADGYEGFTTDLKNKINLLYSLFTREGAGTAASPYVIKANYGLYTNQFLSSLGQNSQGGSGDFDEEQMWIALGTDVEEKVIDCSHIPDTSSLYGYLKASSLNGYATQNWVNSRGFLTSHQSIYALTLKADGTTVTTFTPNNADASLNLIAGTNISLTRGTNAITIANTYSYTLPLATSSTRGGVQIGYEESGKNYAVKLSGEKMYVNVPWTNTTYTIETGDANGQIKVTPSSGNAYNVSVKGLAALAYKASLTTSDIPDLSGTYLPLAGGTLTGSLEISTGSVNNDYNEGLRITRANNKWAGITFGSTGRSGAPTNGWFAALNPQGQFIITPDNSSNTTGLTLNKNGDLKWRDNSVLHSGNYNNYSPTLTGAGASGTWGISISGTASYASTTADTTNILYVVGVTSSATTTLKRDTSITVKGDALSAGSVATTGNVSVGGTLGVTGNTTVGNFMTVSATNSMLILNRPQGASDWTALRLSKNGSWSGDNANTKTYIEFTDATSNSRVVASIGASYAEGIGYLTFGNFYKNGFATSGEVLRIDADKVSIQSNKTLKIGDATISWDSTNQMLKFDKGIYSTGAVSALGANSSGGGGGGGMSLNEVWQSLTNEVADNYSTTKIHTNHIPDMAGIYGYLKQSALSGYVTSVKVGTTAYNPSSGVVSLPAYPTKASWNYDDAYLKLTGGSLSGSLSIQFNGTYPLALKGSDSYNVIHLISGANSSSVTDIGWFNERRGDLAYMANTSSVGVISCCNDGAYYSNETSTFKKYTIYHSGNFTPSNYLPLSGGTMTGTLTIVTNGTSNYNQGIRINRVSTTAWATLLIGKSGNTTAGTGSSTAGDGAWLIATPASSNSLIFNLNDARESVGLCLKGHGTNDIRWNDNIVYHAGNLSPLTTTNYATTLGSVYHPYGGSTSIDFSAKSLIVKGSGNAIHIDNASYTWNGNSSTYPLIYSVGGIDRYTMIAMPHVPFLENGKRSYSGNTYGAILRLESAATSPTYWDIGIPTADTFAIKRAGTEFLVIKNTGILYSVSTYDLESAWHGGAVFGGNSYDKAVISNLQSSIKGVVFGAHNAALNKWAPVHLAGTSVSLCIEQSTRLYINSSGNIGIGTTSPFYKLHVNGTLGVEGTTSIASTLSVSGNTTIGGNIYLSNANSIYSKDANGTDRKLLYLNANNNLFVGTDVADIGGTTTIIGNELRIRIGGTSSDYNALSIDTAKNTTLTGTLRVNGNKIYFGDTSHYVELNSTGFHFSHGVYSDGFMSALGANSSGGGGSDFDEEQMWAALKNNTGTYANEKINANHIPDTSSLYGYLKASSLNGYATQTWVNTRLGGYLPLAGGKMTGSLSWGGNYALPERNSVEYILSIDGFADGGKTYWSSMSTLKSSLGLAALAYKSSLDASDIPNLAASKITSGTFAAARIPDLSSTYATAARATTLEGYFTSGSAKTALALKNSCTLWGQSFDGTANVSGNMTGVGRIDASGWITITQTGTSTARFIAKNDNGAISLYRGNNNAGVYHETLENWLIYTNGTNTIMEIGNVGIGTTSPSYKLDVNGTFNASGNASIGGTATIGSHVYMGFGKILYMQNSESTNQEILAINTNDNLRIGYGIRSGAASVLLYSGSGGVVFRTAGSNTTTASIDDSGNFIAAGEVTASSDARKKNIISDTKFNVRDIASARSVLYEWNDDRDKYNDKKVHGGSIAQDWLGKADSFINQDSDGWYSINYGALALCSAITIAREVVKHSDEIDRLKQEVSYLKAKIAELEERRAA